MYFMRPRTSRPVGLVLSLRALRRRFAGAERGSRVSQGSLNPRCVRVRASQHAPRGRRRVLKRRHGLTEIVDCGALVTVQRPGAWSGWLINLATDKKKSSQSFRF